MKAIITYYKNRNTGEILVKQHISNLPFERPDYFYDWNNKRIDISDLTGFIEISKKKFNREAKIIKNCYARLADKLIVKSIILNDE